MNPNKNPRSFIFYSFFAVNLLLSGCSSSNTRTTTWTGAFFIDSSTVGAINVKYDNHYSQSFIDVSNTYDNISMSFYKRLLANDSSYFVSILESNLKDYMSMEYKVCFQNPWIAYNCGRDSAVLVIYNINTGEKKNLGNNGAPICFSKSCKYLLAERGNGAYTVFNISNGSILAQLPVDVNVAFYIDEDSECVLVYFYSKGIKRFNLISGTYDTTTIGTRDLGTIERIINYGDAVLIFIDSKSQYFYLNQLYLDSILPIDINTQLVAPDIDLKTGNAITARGGVYMENIYGKFNRQTIFTRTEEKL